MRSLAFTEASWEGKHAGCVDRQVGPRGRWGRERDRVLLPKLVHPVNGEVPPVKGRPWKLPHYANRGKTSSSRGELASARSCFSTVRTALGKLRITGLLARFDVARSFPQFPRPLLLQPTIWTSERGADLGSGRCQPRPHLPIYRMTPKTPFQEDPVWALSLEYTPHRPLDPKLSVKI